MLLAKRIKAIRVYKGLSQQTVSDSLDISQSTYSAYETEAGNLKFVTVMKVAEALGCSVPFLTDINSTIVDEQAWGKHGKITH